MMGEELVPLVITLVFAFLFYRVIIKGMMKIFPKGFKPKEERPSWLK